VSGRFYLDLAKIFGSILPTYVARNPEPDPYPEADPDLGKSKNAHTLYLTNSMI
jgi:hypothetical protein